MFKNKAEQFRKQIRREYLNEYFKKKRKQFNLIPQPKENQQQQTIDKLSNKIHQLITQNNKMIPEKGIVDSQDLQIVAKFSQTQMGIECLKKTDIPLLILPYLSPAYYNRIQQHLATSIFANITYLKPEIIPTHQFMRNITNIIENTDIHMQSPDLNHPSIKLTLEDTVDNCLLIIYHLVLQFQQALKFYIEQCDIISLLYRMFQSGISNHLVQKMLKITVIITRYHKGKNNKKVVKKFIKYYLIVLQNINQSQYIYLVLANIKQLLGIYIDAIQPQQNYSRSYQISLNQPMNMPKFNQQQKELQQVQSKIENSGFLEKMTNLYPVIYSKKAITRHLLLIIKIMMAKMEKKTVEHKLFKLFNRLIDGLYKEENILQNEENAQFYTSQKQADKQERLVQLNYIKIEFYQIIYVFLQIWSSDHDLFVNHTLYTKICEKYQDFEETSSSDSPFDYETREYFIHIFGLLAFSGKLNEKMKNLLRESIERYRISKEKNYDQKKSEENEQFEAFISTVEQELGSSDIYTV